MTELTGLERVSQLQNEIIEFTWRQVAEKVDRFYIQGKVTDDDSGTISMVQGDLIFAVVNNQIVNNSDVLDDDEFDKNSEFVLPRIEELHDVLIELQGKSPVRFRWSVDTRTQQVESDWTYYDDLTDEEKKDDSWEGWEGDFAWKTRLEAEVAGL